MSKTRKKSRERAETLRKLTGKPIKPGSRFQLSDGHWYRIRRGRVVRIPDEWVGKPWELVGAPKPWREMKKKRRQSQHKKKLSRQGDWGGSLYNMGRVPREKRKGHPPERKMGHPSQRSYRHATKRERRDRDREDGLL